MSDLFAAIGCAFNCVLWFTCAAIVTAFIGGPILGYWRAGGGAAFGLGLLALFVGIMWVSRPFKKETK